MKSTGASAAYDEEFDKLEEKLRQAQELVKDPSVTPDEMNQLMKDYDDIR